MARYKNSGIILIILFLCTSCSGPVGFSNSGRQEKVTLIVGAFSDEVKPIQAELENKHEGRIEGISFAEGKLRGRQVVVTWTGMGKVNAAATTSLLIEHFRPSEVIVCGIAGGIGPDINVGDVVIAEKSVQHDHGFWLDTGIENYGTDNRITGVKNPVFFEADKKLLDLAMRAGNQAALQGIAAGTRAKVKKGVIASGDTFIMSPQKKIDLQKRLGADAVEMEGAAIAQICYQQGVPLLIIRGISDAADEKADKDVDTFQNVAIKNAVKVTCKMMELMPAGSIDLRQGVLKVSQNNRFLVYKDGSPFFYLGDTAWELFHRLNREEAEKYLENRRQKGFTVIQAVALAELDGLRVPNAYGYRPLMKTDGRFDSCKPDIREGPDNDYWDHVDWIIDKAAEKGLYIGLLPTWGDKIDKKWGVGPVIFDVNNARIYGQWIGNRYKDKVNIIWILGGDRSGGGKNKSVWDALAEGIKSVDSHHLMTFHPIGGSSSSEWFQTSDWLNFNMLQSGHGGRDIPNYLMIRKDYGRKPIKPCFDGEPRYEDMPVGFHSDGKAGWFDDFDVRQAVYWSVFAGGHGVTYGCNNIWQMYAPGRSPVLGARRNWYDSLDMPGAFDMINLRRLMESRPMLARVPDPSLIAEGQTSGPDHIETTRGDDYIFIYTPYGKPFKITMGKISGKGVTAWWYNPRNGGVERIGDFDNSGTREFAPSGNTGRGNDWVLVLDDSAKKYSPPGTYISH